jgi:hypothetical protein
MMMVPDRDENGMEGECDDYIVVILDKFSNWKAVVSTHHEDKQLNSEKGRIYKFGKQVSLDCFGVF